MQRYLCMLVPRRRALTVALLAAGLAGGCGGAPAQPWVDLVDAFDTAETVVETRVLDAGDEASRRHLVGGFSSRTDWDAGRRRAFVWGTGATSAVDLPLAAVRDVPLTLEGRPYPGLPSPPQRLRLTVNGTDVDAFDMPRGLGRFETVLPAGALRVGQNRLGLHYAASVRPSDLDPAAWDGRDLAAAWYRLELGTPREDAGDWPTAPRADAGDGLLFVPWGSAVHYHLALPADAELRLGGLSFRGAPAAIDGGRLEIVVTPDGDGEPTLVPVTAEDPPSAIPLAAAVGDGPRIVRLALRARGPGDAAPAGGVALARPTLWTAAPPSAAAATPAAAADPPRRPHLLVYLVDTLRADHLGCYGYDRPTSPRIDAFAAESVLFERAVAQSSWTRAAVASIFTGRWPRAHGANLRSDALADGAETLAERLAAAGYRTAGWTVNPNVSAELGFAQGFEVYEELPHEADAEDVHRAALAWLDAEAPDAGTDPGVEPLFLYLHTIDPHAPYDAPAPWRERWAPDAPRSEAWTTTELLRQLHRDPDRATPDVLRHVIDLYDAEVAYQDHAFGELLDALAARELLDDTAIVFVSDHGEEFGEHGGFQHGKALHAESLDVPLVVRPPGGLAGGRRIPARVQHTDLLPTLLAWAGAPADGALPGRDLLPAIRGDGAASLGDARVLAYLHLDDAPMAAVHDGRWKLIQQLERPGGGLYWPRLYDRRADRAETAELQEARPVRRGYLAAVLRGALLPPPLWAAEAGAMDAETEEALRALGYID